MCRASSGLASENGRESIAGETRFDKIVGRPRITGQSCRNSRCATMRRTVSAYIGLLRAVNLPGHNKIDMAALRELASAIGLKDAQTLLQSGNLVFQSDARGSAQLEQLLEREAARRLGLTTDFFVRSTDEWQSIITGNPFPKEAES